MKPATTLPALLVVTTLFGCGQSDDEAKLTAVVDEVCRCQDVACLQAAGSKLLEISGQLSGAEAARAAKQIDRAASCSSRIQGATAEAATKPADAPEAALPPPASPVAPPEPTGAPEPSVAPEPTGAPAVTTSLPEAIAEIRADPGSDLKEIGAKVRALAGRGLEARAALLELAADPALPENHRRVAGLLSAEVLLFRPDESTRLALTSDNPVQVVGAAHNLALLGGEDHHATLDKVAARFAGKDPRLVESVTAMREASPAVVRLGERQLALLDKVYGLRTAEDVNMSGAALVVDHRANLDWALDRMLELPMERDHQLTILALKKSYERSK